MFGLKYGFGFGFTSGYSPLINYSWSSTYQANNQMYSTNSGTGTDLQLYSGQGVKFNGVDQGVNDVLNGLTYPYSLQVTSNGRDGYIVSSLYTNSERLYLYIAGGIYYLRLGEMVTTNTLIASSSNDFISLIVEEGTYALKVNNKEVSSSFVTSGTGFVNRVRIGLDPNSVGSSSGTLKDLFIFNRALTQAEITKYSTSPNGFFNDALVDNTCVLNMPLAEHSDYCTDYANYSEGSEKAINGAFVTDTDWTKGVDWSIGDGKASHVSTSLSYLEQDMSLENGKFYRIDFEITEHISGGVGFSGTMGDRSFTGTFSTIGKYFIFLTSNGSDFRMFSNGVNSVDNISVKQLSGVHQIENYTDSCRDEAKQLPYGTQNANYKINGLGMRTEESPHFECSELFDNYGDTGWIPSADEDWSIELVLSKDTDDVEWYMGTQAIDRCFIATNGADPRRLKYAIGDMASYLGDTYEVGENIHLVLIYSSGGSFKSYENNISKADAQTSLSVQTTSFFIGVEAYLNKYMTDGVRLFKAHQKALTQEEVTKAYTDAVNKGLLS